jgi:hypothetical protein
LAGWKIDRQKAGGIRNGVALKHLRVGIGHGHQVVVVPATLGEVAPEGRTVLAAVLILRTEEVLLMVVVVVEVGLAS